MDESTDPQAVVRTPGDEVAERPRWERPEVTVLDVERGTMTTSGPVSDGNGSTS
jgi:hypothetical protein